jgi:hypothetical protein
MKKNSWLTPVSLLLLPAALGIVIADVAGLFAFSDMPFALAFVLYGLFVITQKTKSNITVRLMLFFLVWMGFSYVPTGAGKITERIGEWFYLLFVFGLIQYAREAWKSAKQ